MVDCRFKYTLLCEKFKIATAILFSTKSVHGLVRKKTEDIFHSNFIDCEVQMLSKTCTAIKRYLVRKNKIKPAYYSINFRFRKQSKQGQVYVHADHFEVRFTDLELVKEFGGLLIFGLDKVLRSARITDAVDSTDLIRAICAELK